MKSVKINLKMAETVKSFVNITQKYDYNMDLRSGRFVVDAKSILGIFSLDLGKPLVLEIYAPKCDDLIAELSSFIEK